MSSNGGSSDYDFLLDRLSQNAQRNPNKLAFAFLSPGPDGGKISKQLTYQELEQQTSALALALSKRHGLSKGDRAVLVYPPSLDFMIGFLACLKAGIVAVPVFPPNPLRRDTLQMFSKIVSNCGAKVALTNKDYNHVKTISTIKDAVQLKRSVAAWPENLQWIVTTNDDMLQKTTTSASQPPSLSPVASDLAFLQYTSGSTSDPKGVMITQGNLAHNLTIITRELGANQDTIEVSWLPQYHDMGLIGSYLGCLYCGGTGYYISPLSFLQRPMLWIEAVSKYQGTHLQAPNFAFKLTARKFQASQYNPSSLKLASVRHIINAAEPVDAESIDTFYQTFGPFGLRHGVIFPTYGLAEHTVFVCSGGNQRLSVDKQLLEVDGRVQVVADGENDASTSTRISHLVGCGYPAHQKVNVKIVNTSTLEAVEDDVVGEIWVSSPSKAAGYFQKEQETKDDFHGKLQGDSSGTEYLRTGDLGFLHNGELFICGRLKDLIIIGGRNYYPQDLEATAESASEKVRPGCSAAFTIDPTHEGGEEVALVMELKEVPADKKAIQEVCEALADQVRGAINQEHALAISEIAFVRTKTIPKTSSGKIARSWCRKGFIAGTLDVVYRRSFKSSGQQSFEISGGDAPPPKNNTSAQDSAKIRSMSKEALLAKLKNDIARVGSIPPDSVKTDVALVTMLDSLTISQLKGLLENHYAVKISDEYLFRESTSLVKLVEVVKLGYAPDDGDGSGAHVATAPSGTATGLAGMLGCPPGVVCAIL